MESVLVSFFCHSEFISESSFLVFSSFSFFHSVGIAFSADAVCSVPVLSKALGESQTHSVLDLLGSIFVLLTVQRVFFSRISVLLALSFSECI